MFFHGFISLYQSCMLSGSVVCNSDSMDCRPNRLCPWNSPGKNTGVGCHFLPQGSSDPGVESMSLLSPVLAGGFLTTKPPGKPLSKLSRFLGRTISIDKNCHNFAMPWIFFFWHYHLQALILFLYLFIGYFMEKEMAAHSSILA